MMTYNCLICGEEFTSRRQRKYCNKCKEEFGGKMYIMKEISDAIQSRKLNETPVMKRCRYCGGVSEVVDGFCRYCRENGCDLLMEHTGRSNGWDVEKKPLEKAVAGWRGTPVIGGGNLGVHYQI